MRAIPFHNKSDAKDLKISDWPTPQIGDDEVLIKVATFGLNYADIMARKGMYPDAPPFPFVPGYEVSGTVAEVGKSVKHLKKGARVMALTSFGGYAEYAKTPGKGAIEIPKGLSFANAAAIPVNYVTAYHAIFHTGVVSKGMKILIHAAAGGVGIAAIQLAKNAGLEIYGTASSQAKLDLISKLGVDYPINYSEQDFVEVIKKINEGKGVDIILDSIGGKYLKKDLNILNANGRVASFGVSGISDRSVLGLLSAVPDVLSMFTLSAITLLKGSMGFYGVNMKVIGDQKPELLAMMLKNILQLFAAKKLTSHVHHEYSWKDIAKAQEILENRKSTGKIILHVD